MQERLERAHRQCDRVNRDIKRLRALFTHFLQRLAPLDLDDFKKQALLFS